MSGNTLEFLIDGSGTPVARFYRNEYINILPVTKYQFERFIWKAAPSWCNYHAIIEKIGRISPVEINQNNLSSIFITEVSFKEALEYSKFFGGRLPTLREWDRAYDSIFTRGELFEEALKYMESVPVSRIDKRIIKLVEYLIKHNIKRTDLNDAIKELVCEFPVTAYPGRIYLKYCREDYALVAGNPSTETRGKEFGFCMVVRCNAVNHKP